MTKLYERMSGNPKLCAQRNLAGRTHYVDDDTLKFHKSRILNAHTVDSGLLYTIVESVATDYENTKRGCRYVVFDLFGHVVSRVPLEECWKTRDQATKAMWAFLDTIDAKAVTLEALERVEKRQAWEAAELRKRFEVGGTHAPAIVA